MSPPKCPYCGAALARISPNVWRCEGCSTTFRVARGRAVAFYRRAENTPFRPMTPSREAGLREDQLLFVAQRLNISTAAAEKFVKWASRAYNVSEDLILSQSVRGLRALYSEYLKHLAEQS